MSLRERTRDVKDLLGSSGVAKHECECIGKILHLPQLSDLLAAVGHTDGAVLCKPLEEELLDWVVVQWAVNVHGAHRCEVGSPLLQQILCVQLSLVPGLQVCCVLFPACKMASC